MIQEKEFNKKCSEFLEFELSEFDNDCYQYKPLNFYGYISKMKFHEDWNWIMEIKKFINGIGCSFFIFPDNVTIKENRTISSKTISSIHFTIDEKTATLTAINEFLDWYNGRKRENNS